MSSSRSVNVTRKPASTPKVIVEGKEAAPGLSTKVLGERPGGATEVLEDGMFRTRVPAYVT